MELTGARAVQAPTSEVWRALHDPQTLKCCIPGCASIEPDGVDVYRMTLVAKVGPVSARFAGKMHVSNLDPPHAYTLRFEGTGGPAGFVNGEARITLTSGDAGATTLSYVAKAQVGGKLAQIGSRLIDGAAQKLTEEFFAQFAATMRPSTEELRAQLAPVRRTRRLIYAAVASAIVAALAVLYLVSRG